MVTLKTHAQVGNAVRAAREKQGMTQRQLARVSGVSLRSITDLELGVARNIGLDRLMRVFETLGLSLIVCENDTGPKTEREQLARNASYEDALKMVRGEA